MTRVAMNLAISGGNSLDITPLVGSDRYKANRITLGEETAQGISTVQGITARHDLYVWKLDFWLSTWQMLALEEIIELQQSRLAAKLSTAVVTLSDRWFFTNSYAITKPGRTPLDTAQTVNGISGRYCAFGVILEKGQGFNEPILMGVNLNGKEKISLIVKEL